MTWHPSKALVLTPAPPLVGGLGRAAGDFRDGLEMLAVPTEVIGPQPSSLLTRLAASRVARRASKGPHRMALARDVRLAAPQDGWDFAYAVAGCAPRRANGATVAIYQATRYPVIEFEALRHAERETGGQGDFSRAEVRRRLAEIDRVDLVHVTTTAVRDEFLNAGVPAEKLVHVYHGVDLDEHRPGAKPDDLRIAFVGPLSMRKGVDLVAELARRLRGSATVMAVGGPTDPWSRRIVEGAHFDMRRSVPEMLAEAHVLVLPSRSDAFAFVVLEALASGAVPIVTPEVGASEVVRHLDDRLVLPRAEFVGGIVELLPTLDLADLSRRAVALAGRFERRQQARQTAEAVLAAAERLGPKGVVR